jgi:hypothetical protein
LRSASVIRCAARRAATPVERLAEFEHLAQRFGAAAEDHRAAARPDLDQARALEDVERVTHRCATRIEDPSEVGHAQMPARLQLAGQNGPAQLIGHVIGQ